VQQIQESMSVEQKLFDSINHQLAVADKDSAEHKNQSAALCASQARLARLCARNMRCFMQVGFLSPHALYIRARILYSSTITKITR
jgi:hypothetical protein